jgi:hypothetical protein
MGRKCRWIERSYGYGLPIAPLWLASSSNGAISEAPLQPPLMSASASAHFLSPGGEHASSSHHHRVHRRDSCRLFKHLRLAAHVHTCEMKAYIAVPAIAALVYRAYSHKSLTPTGIAAAIVTGIIHAIHPWNMPFVLLAVFFLAGSRVTKVSWLCHSDDPIASRSLPSDALLANRSRQMSRLDSRLLRLVLRAAKVHGRMYKVSV